MLSSLELYMLFFCHFLWCELSELLCNILVITYLLLSLSFPVSWIMHINTGVLIHLLY